MKSFLKYNKINLIFSALSIIFVFVLWQVCFFIVGNDYLVPSLNDTVTEFFTLFSEAFFWKAFLNTFLRVLSAFAVSFILGAVCSILSVFFKPFNSFINPIITILRALPTMAALLIILLWLSPKTAPVLICVLVLFPLIYTQINAQINAIDSGILQMAKVYNLPFYKRLTKIYLPLTLPGIFLYSGSNLSFAIKIVVSAEVMANTLTALGGLMQTANLYLQTSRLAALTIVAVILGLLIEGFFALLYKVIFKWKRGE
ncbi:MAG: ABC transporter permease subunit [Clostridiales bacterium]|nr:ABC transporter permease subunit [Clostridiales bacterium]